MGPIKKEVSEMKKIKFVPIARTKGVCDNEKDIEENGMEVLSKNDQRMTLLRGHLCHPFRAYFTCRIATFLCCEGCDFPGTWLLFGRIFELKMKKASKWLGIQISSLERNLRTSGFKMVSDSILTGSRVYIFPFNQQVTRAKEQVMKELHIVILRNKTKYIVMNFFEQLICIRKNVLILIQI